MNGATRAANLAVEDNVVVGLEPDFRLWDSNPIPATP